MHAEAGRWGEARLGWLEALDFDPDSIAVMLEISYVESFAGHYRQAREWALRAAQAKSRSTDDLVPLIHRLRTFNEVPALRSIVGQAMADRGTPVAVLVESARQLSNLNDFGLALRCAEAAVAKAPGDLAARLVRGQLLASHGRIDEACLDIQWGLERNPGIPAAWWMLSRLYKQTVGSNHIGQLRALLATPGLHPEHAALLARALHKELDDIGAHDEAWSALEALFRAKRASEQYDREEHRRLVESLIAWPPGASRSTGPELPGKVPLFVVGMHRSGTTLLEQLLNASPQVLGLGELNDFTSAMRHGVDHYCKGTVDRTIVQRANGLDLSEVGRGYMDGVAWRLGDETCFADKQPSNYLNIGFICRALPQAKILHMVRDPVETCFSNLRELFSEINPHSYDLADMADYFLEYRRLMGHWHAIFPGRILDVDYARLTAKPEETMREVAAFCGIEYTKGMNSTASSGRAIATASSIQVREEVVRRERPKWAPYARHLQPLIATLRQGGVEVRDPPA
jgi:tetratricopeptide (TPR) repeat protein